MIQAFIQADVNTKMLYVLSGIFIVVTFIGLGLIIKTWWDCHKKRKHRQELLSSVKLNKVKSDEMVANLVRRSDG